MGGRVTHHAWAVLAVVAATGVVAGAAPANPIPAENLRPGTTQWLAPEAEPPAIEGYSSTVSAAPGDTISFHVSTDPAASYRVLVYRLGWYGGATATLLECLPDCQGHYAGSPMPSGFPIGILGEIRADWPAAATLSIPTSWVSGYYVANLALTGGPGAGTVDRVPFVVRAPPSRQSQILAQVPVNTWQAYNGWGGKSLYEHSSTGRRAAAVSFDRPYFIGPGRQELTDWEISLVRWLERGGYDISYQTDVDTHREPSSLDAHRLVLTLGHDEYWTKEMRDAFEATRDSGTNLGFLGANAAYWQVRYENRERTMVSHKSLYDPEPRLELKTALFREVGRPECALLGVQHQGGLQNWGRHDYVVTAAGANDPWAAGTGFVEGSRIANVVSVERDTVPSIGCGNPTVLFRYDAGGDTIGDAAAVRYTAPSGARVFSAGTMELGWVLDEYPGPSEGTGRVDARLQTFMANAMDDLTRPAPARRVDAAMRGDRVRVEIQAQPDARVRWDIVRRSGLSDAPISDPGWRTVCRGVATSCVDLNPPAGPVRYGAVAVDLWGRSAPTFAAPVVVREVPPPQLHGVLVMARRIVDGPRTTYDLFAVDLRRGTARRLTRSSGSELEPAWSHDGRRLAFTVARTSDGVPPAPAGPTAVFVADAERTNGRRLRRGRNPTWSPGGRMIAFERGGSIFVLDIATGRARTVASGRDPTWSRRGTIAFVRPSGIWTVSPGRGAPRLFLEPDRRVQPDSALTEPPDHASVEAPEWSPDGRWIAFVNRQASQGPPSVTDLRVHVARADARNRRSYPLEVSRPTWSADGRWVLGAGADGRICMVRRGGAGSPRCLRLRGLNFDPAWRHDRR